MRFDPTTLNDYERRYYEDGLKRGAKERAKLKAQVARWEAAIAKADAYSNNTMQPHKDRIYWAGYRDGLANDRQLRRPAQQVTLPSFPYSLITVKGTMDGS